MCYADGSDSDCSDISLLEVDSDIEERIQAAMAAIGFEDQLDKCIQWVQSKQTDIDGGCAAKLSRLSALCGGAIKGGDDLPAES